MKKTLLILLAAAVLLAPGSLAEKRKPSRAYFENLDKDSSLEAIVEDIGPCGIQGSGILYHVWRLNDGSAAKVVFDSRGRIAMIYISGPLYSERIYKRQYAAAGSGIPEAELREAVRKMGRAISEKRPHSAMIVPPDGNEADLFDITGDGYPELFTTLTWGSGKVRTDLAVYDPAEEALYILDGYDHDYSVEYVDETRIVIGREEPGGKKYGTVRVENGKLVFVPGAGEP